MIHIEEQDFQKIVADAIDAIPPQFGEHLSNVVFTVQDRPDQNQRHAAQLQPHETLYGLYQGIPLTRRGSNYSMVLPDKITIFRLPILEQADSYQAAARQVYKTVWHEVAHYYGLGHDKIREIEQKYLQTP